MYVTSFEVHCHCHHKNNLLEFGFKTFMYLCFLQCEILMEDVHDVCRCESQAFMNISTMFQLNESTCPLVSTVFALGSFDFFVSFPWDHAWFHSIGSIVFALSSPSNCWGMEICRSIPDIGLWFPDSSQNSFRWISTGHHLKMTPPPLDAPR